MNRSEHRRPFAPSPGSASDRQVTVRRPPETTARRWRDGRLALRPGHAKVRDLFEPAWRLICSMHTKNEGTYTRTDMVVAIILAVIAALWIIAYIIAFVRSGVA